MALVLNEDGMDKQKKGDKAAGLVGLAQDSDQISARSVVHVAAVPPTSSLHSVYESWCKRFLMGRMDIVYQ